MNKSIFFAQKAIILSKDNQNILVSKFASSKYLPDKLNGKLCLPGGKIEFGENLKEGFDREIFEETGIKCTFGHPFYTYTWQYQKDDTQVQIVANVILSKYLEGELTKNPIAPSGEITYDNPRWIPIHEIVIDNFVVDEQPILLYFLKNKDRLIKNFEY